VPPGKVRLENPGRLLHVPPMRGAKWLVRGGRVMQRICYTKLRDQGFSEQEALFLVGMQFYPRKFWEEEM